jgi:hypothetical protein
MRQDITTLTGVHDDNLSTVTGKTWAEWKHFLDAAQASEKSIDEARSIMRSYRRIQDELENLILRFYFRLDVEEGVLESASELDFTSTLTVNAPLHITESAFTDAALRKQWLSESEEILKHNPGKNLRFAWNTNQMVVVTFIPKGRAKCQISLQHSKISDSLALIELKAFWKERLATLGRFLEGK